MDIIFKENINISHINNKDDTQSKAPYKYIFGIYTT